MTLPFFSSPCRRACAVALPAWVAIVLAFVAPPGFATDPSAEVIREWIDQLGAEQFADREAASRSLAAAGPAALGPLADAARGGDLEVASRAIEVIRGPGSAGVSIDLHLHVDDADAAIQRARDAGAVLVRPASDAFYGERSGRVRDPFGHEWSIGHSIEDVTPEEMQRRYTAMFAE